MNQNTDIKTVDVSNCLEVCNFSVSEDQNMNELFATGVNDFSIGLVGYGIWFL